MAYSVYCHTCVANGKQYIGLTKNDPKQRWLSGRGYAQNKKFSADIKKYGWGGFSHIILADGLSKEEAQAQERYFIDKLDTINAGYNNNPGGTAPEHTFLSTTLSAFRRSMRRKNVWMKIENVKSVMSLLEAGDNDKELAMLLNEMAKNALCHTRTWFGGRDVWDDESFLGNFFSDFSHEIRVVNWINGGCVGERPTYKDPFQIRADAIFKN